MTNKPLIRFKEFAHKNWPSISIGKLATKLTSGSRDWAKYYSSEGSLFIRMTNLPRRGINLKLDDLKYVDVTSNSADGKRTSLEAGDILMSITAELGKIGWVPEGLGKAYINQHTALIRIDPKSASSKFIAHQLSSPQLNKRINKLNDSGAKAGLNLPSIKSLSIFAPEIEEQNKVASFLSTVDKKIELLALEKELLYKYKSNLVRKIFNQEIRFKDSSGNSFPDWVPKSIRELEDEGLIELGRGEVISKIDLKNTPGNYPVFSSSINNDGLFGAWGNYIFDEEMITWSIDGGGNFFFRPKEKFSITNVSGYIKFKTIELVPYFIYLCLENKHKDFKFDYISKAHPSVIRDLYEIEIPCAEEQLKIADFLKLVNSQIDLCDRQLKGIEIFKRGLLQQMFI